MTYGKSYIDDSEIFHFYGCEGQKNWTMSKREKEVNIVPSGLFSVITFFCLGIIWQRPYLYLYWRGQNFNRFNSDLIGCSLYKIRMMYPCLMWDIATPQPCMIPCLAFRFAQELWSVWDFLGKVRAFALLIRRALTPPQTLDALISFIINTLTEIKKYIKHLYALPESGSPVLWIILNGSLET